MTKIVLFPYHPDIELLAEHRELLSAYEIVGVVSWKEDEKVLADISKKLQINQLSYSEMMRACDQVILLDNYRGYKNDKYYKVIEDAINNGLQIRIVPSMLQKLNLEKYEGMYVQLEEPFDYTMFKIDDRIIRDVEGEGVLADIEIPIIAVVGMGKNCSKFETLLLTKDVLEKDYNIVTISSNAIGAILGCYTMPNFMFDDVSAERKIYEFNHFVKQISDKNDIDAILIEIPEGIASFNRLESNHFGEYAFVITSAVHIDFLLLCTYFFGKMMGSDNIELFADAVERRFGTPVAGVAVAKVKYEVPDAEQDIIYINLSEKYLTEYYPDIENDNRVIAINLKDTDKARVGIGRCINRLIGNAAAM